MRVAGSIPLAPAKQDFFEVIGTFVRYGLVFGLLTRNSSPLALPLGCTCRQWMVSADQVPILADGQLSSWTKPGVS